MTGILATYPHILIPIEKLRKKPLRFTIPPHFKMLRKPFHPTAKGSSRDYATLHKYNREVGAVTKIRQKFWKKYIHTQ